MQGILTSLHSVEASEKYAPVGLQSDNAHVPPGAKYSIHTPARHSVHFCTNNLLKGATFFPSFFFFFFSKKKVVLFHKLPAKLRVGWYVLPSHSAPRYCCAESDTRWYLCGLLGLTRQQASWGQHSAFFAHVSCVEQRRARFSLPISYFARAQVTKFLIISI